MSPLALSDPPGSVAPHAPNGRRRPGRLRVDPSTLSSEPVGQPLDYRTLPPADPLARRLIERAGELAGEKKQKIALPELPAFVLWLVERYAKLLPDRAKATATAILIEYGTRKLWMLNAVAEIARYRETCVQRADPVQMTWFDSFPPIAVSPGDSVTKTWQTHVPSAVVRPAAHLASVLGMAQGRLQTYALLVGLLAISGDAPANYQLALRHSVARLRDILEERAITAKEHAEGRRGTAEDLDRAMW